MREGTSTFRPIRDAASRLTTILAASFAGWLVLGRFLRMLERS
jgi:hypothetical protein